MSPGWQKYSKYTVWEHNLHCIFTKFFDIRHLYLPAASECQAGVGLCPVTWITMNHHSQYWAQWHFKSLLAIEWGSHLAWMNKRGRMEGGRGEDKEEGGRQRGRWRGRREAERGGEKVSGQGRRKSRKHWVQPLWGKDTICLPSCQWISDTV